MTKRKKNFILGCTFFALATFVACVLPFILKYFDIYYVLSVETYKKVIITLATIGLFCFIVNDKYYSKELVVIFLGILFAIALKFLPL